ncbi:MAG: GMP synthase (glutamine-hydrolyzing) [Candidatus Paceibacteria bacterium]|jgi:GMP synthase (glutamine-hydrolysing)
MSQLPFLILDCYYDEIGAAPNFRALLEGAPSTTVRLVREPAPVDLSGYRGILITGSRANIPDPEPWMEGLFELVHRAQQLEVPLLGICFGHQAIAAAIGGPGAVRTAPRGELGWNKIEVGRATPILAGLDKSFTCFVSHFDEVSPDTEGLEVFASSQDCAVQGFQVRGQRTWGLQFHPEMDPLESETLVRSNASRHRGLEQGVAELMAERIDGRDLGAIIFRNFAELCH